jgi:hypothetical protein
MAFPTTCSGRFVWNRKMALKAKLHDTKMGKEESVSSYLT